MQQAEALTSESIYLYLRYPLGGSGGGGGACIRGRSEPSLQQEF